MKIILFKLGGGGFQGGLGPPWLKKSIARNISKTRRPVSALSCRADRGEDRLIISNYLARQQLRSLAVEVQAVPEGARSRLLELLRKFVSLTVRASCTLRIFKGHDRTLAFFFYHHRYEVWLAFPKCSIYLTFVNMKFDSHYRKVRISLHSQFSLVIC